LQRDKRFSKGRDTNGTAEVDKQTGTDASALPCVYVSVSANAPQSAILHRIKPYPRKYRLGIDKKKHVKAYGVDHTRRMSDEGGGCERSKSLPQEPATRISQQRRRYITHDGALRRRPCQ
jgi:hypothetical protein